jgi:hypothetical protein
VRTPIDHDRPSSSSGAFIARAESAASARIGVSHRTPSDGALAPRNGTPRAGSAREGAEPDGVGLARAGGRVQQAALPRRHRRPDLALESERLPAAGRKPGFGQRGVGDRRVERVGRAALLGLHRDLLGRAFLHCATLRHARRRRHQAVFRDAGLRRS